MCTVYMMYLSWIEKFLVAILGIGLQSLVSKVTPKYSHTVYQLLTEINQIVKSFAVSPHH